MWGLLHDGLKHSAENCTRWVWHDNCRNPKDAATPWCREHEGVDLNFNDRPIRAEDKKMLRKAKRRGRS